MRSLCVATGAVLLPCIILAGMFTLLASISSVAAAECVTDPQWRESVATRSTGVSIVVMLDADGEKAKAAIGRFNSAPPASEYAGDHIVILGAKQIADDMPLPYFLLAVFDGGCIAVSGKVTPEAVKTIMVEPGNPA